MNTYRYYFCFIKIALDSFADTMAENQKNRNNNFDEEKKNQLELDRSVGYSPANFQGGPDLGLTMHDSLTQPE
jgi:hypothetical protein